MQSPEELHDVYQQFLLYYGQQVNDMKSWEAKRNALAKEARPKILKSLPELLTEIVIVSNLKYGVF